MSASEVNWEVSCAKGGNRPWGALFTLVCKILLGDGFLSVWQVFLQEIHQPFYNYLELWGKRAAITFSHPKVLHGGGKKRLEHLITMGGGGEWGSGGCRKPPQACTWKRKPARVYVGDACRVGLGKSTPSRAIISLNNKHNWNKISWKFLRF